MAEKPKTYKREVAFGLLLFWASMLSWGLYSPDPAAVDAAISITIPVLMVVAGAFGIDAALKQGTPK